MKQAHGPEHEARLQAFLTSDGDCAPPDEWLSCEQCRESLAALGAVAARLEQEREAEEALREEAQALEEAPNEDLVEAVLRPRLDALARRRALGSRTRLLGLAAAAVIMLLAFVFFHEKEQPGGEILLGSKRVECLAPLGGTARYDLFEWRAPLPPGGHFELRIFEDDPEGHGPALLTRSFESNRWVPTESQAQSLPSPLIWELSVFDATGVEVGHGRARAWRSR